MKKIIKEKYNSLIANSTEFKVFVESMQKQSTNEIIDRYELKNNIIASYYSGLSEMPT